MDKNIAKGSDLEMLLEKGFMFFRLKNEGIESTQFKRNIDSTYIQFHFCLKGKVAFLFNGGNYAFSVKESSSMLLYNPRRDLPIDMVLEPNTWVISVVISITKFHALFSEDAHHISFISQENKKYYTDGQISPAISVLLSQLMNGSVHPSIRKLYLKGKIYELIALYFNKSEDADLQQCPFLIDEDNVRKIRQAKDIILSRMAAPPSLQDLSAEVRLSLKKLKEGFKQLYGATVFGFLLDHKMEIARKMLESGQHNVNEVSHKVGYSTSSHFIAAFKKKFGTTPKKYLMSLPS